MIFSSSTYCQYSGSVMMGLLTFFRRNFIVYNFIIIIYIYKVDSTFINLRKRLTQLEWYIKYLDEHCPTTLRGKYQTLFDVLILLPIFEFYCVQIYLTRFVNIYLHIVFYALQPIVDFGNFQRNFAWTCLQLHPLLFTDVLHFLFILGASCVCGLDYKLYINFLVYWDPLTT